MMKKSYLSFAIISLIVLIAVLTNPKQDRHKEVIKSKLTSYMQKSMRENLKDTDKEAEQAGQVLGMMLGGVLVDGILNNLVSIDNYVLFSTTKIIWEGQANPIFRR